MQPELARLLPVPGPVWGSCPMRPADDRAPPWRRPQWRSAAAQGRQVMRAARQAAEAWRPKDSAARAAALPELRRQLRREGLHAPTLAGALGVAAACAEQTLGWAARDTQLLAASVLLGNRMAEMATGEGKTLAIGLAAAVAALAGMPVHVVTANPYLAARDAARLAPFFEALGLSVTALGAAAPGDDAARRAAYAHDIVYTTAKDLAFDFLRDRQAAAEGAPVPLVPTPVPAREAASASEPAPASAPTFAPGPAPASGSAPAAAPALAAAPPRLRGLCLALLDEADSILLDEAEIPLILSRAVPQADRRALLWQALALARRLAPDLHFVAHAADRMVTLTPAGEQRLAELASPLGGAWLRPRYRREALQVALAGLHLYHRNAHYIVREGRIELLDEVTARVAEGRVWSRGLHTVVALKEGVAPPPETETVAQTTFQRFFQRYWRLAGISGTLWEARAELREVYGAAVVRIPLHRPCQRIEQPMRRFDGRAAMERAVLERIAGLVAIGRPVLVGTDSVADSQRLSELLASAGLAHRVLDALHDADEAAVVAEAGRTGRITVATRMAGRGTDIELDDEARAAGGLHVLCLQDNPSHRLDRQLAGRAGRHGDPGSAETWLCRVGPALSGEAPADNGERWKPRTPPPARPTIARLQRRWTQWREESRRAVLRRRLLEQDLHWERRLAFAGAER